MHLSGLELAIASLAVVVGATVQGSIGFGKNLVAVPVVALLEPSALPGTLILVAFPMTVVMALTERDAIDRAGFAWITVGRVPGTVLGVVIVAVLTSDALSGLIGAFVLVAVAMSVGTVTVPVNRETALGAGVASGAMGTAAAIGGPPLALLYQHHEGPVLRSTLAVSFVVGTLVSFAGLAIGGQVEAWQLLLGLSLMPALAAGLLLSRLVSPALDARWLRPAVLGFAAFTGVIALLRGVL
jgi:uncharacterized protein